MGLFDGLIGSVGSAVGGALVEAVTAAVADPANGGLQGLVDKASAAGLGEHAASWVGQAANLAITAEQAHAVLGGDMVQALASKLNLSPAEVASGLAQALPEVVNHLTPEGVVPTPGSGGLQAGLAALSMFTGL